ncbi:MAG: hypothetical protein NT125_08680 [Candidatus Bipolaricaulota bacterium]|nr:hypothetical protein [Candidatus Bipolaricaulota bacterium]
MPSSSHTQNKRQSLFKIYSQQLERLNPDYKDLYGCPICHRLLGIDATRKDAPQEARLTLDHIPPHACGGQDEVLVCFKCNSEAGSGQDAELHRGLLQAADRRNGQFAIDPTWSEAQGFDRAWLGAREHDLVVRVRTRPGGIEVFPEPGVTDPDKYEGYLKERLRGDGPVELQLQFPRGTRQRDLRPADKTQAQASLFRSAYLSAFLHLGYAYILLRHVSVLREWIQVPEKHIEDIGTAVVAVPSSTGVPWGATTLCFVELPEKRSSCLGVALQANLEGYERHYMVLLPPPVTDERTSFPTSEMRSLRDTQSNVKLRMVGLARRVIQERFREESHPVAALAELWNALLNEFS